MSAAVPQSSLNTSATIMCPGECLSLKLEIIVSSDKFNPALMEFTLLTRKFDVFASRPNTFLSVSCYCLHIFGTNRGAENKTTSTASAGVMNTTTAGINTTGVFTTTSPTTTVRIAKTTTSTTAALKVVERSTKLSKPSTSGSGHHLLDEVDRGLRERGISISHETFRVTLMWDEDVDIDLQLLVAHEQGVAQL
eukprot:170529-Amphidinium_carterae.1